MPRLVAIGPALLACLTALPSHAQQETGICAYKPSRLAGAAADKLSGTGDLAKTGAKAVGNYMLTHPEQGVSFVTGAASTLSGAAAGAGGAGGLASGVVAVVTAPVTLAVGAVTFAAAGSYEGLCYLKVDRVTDPDDVRAIIDDISGHDPLVWTRNTNKGPVMVLAGPDGETTYAIKDLYIADGDLKLRNWGPNKTLGSVAYVQPEAEILPTGAD
ncbi:hypothetical protein [Sagittula sp. SSi028]|uniref:hypothetical protein n=1 Tax=Sagittula sp. SSi028 TaxID=3400636 RepID=UPI003AF94E5B